MMVEEDKLRLTDPVSKFIPEWKNMTVGVPLPAAQAGGARGGRAGGPPAEPRYYTVPIERELTIRDLLTHVNGVVSGPIGQSANRAVAAKPNEVLADYIPSNQEFLRDFENMVMQAVVGNSSIRGVGTN